MFIFVFLLINLIFSFDAVEGVFIDNPIRIFSSNANHIFLAKNTSSNSIVHVSKFAVTDTIYSTFMISKIDKEYYIKVNNEYMCEKDSDITLCQNKETWKIKPETIGYKIGKKNDKCLTLESSSRVVLSSCSVEKDQIFDFKLAEDDEKCEDTIANKKPNPATQKLTVDFDLDKLVLGNDSIKNILKTQAQAIIHEALNHKNVELTDHEHDHTPKKVMVLEDNPYHKNPSGNVEIMTIDLSKGHTNINDHHSLIYV